MKYHTTFKDIAVSILVVLSSAAVCLYGLVFFNIGNPAQPLVSYFLKNLDRGNTISVSIDTLDREFFKTIDLKGLSISIGDTTPVIAKSVSLKQPLQTVFLSLFTGNKTFDITVDYPVLDSDFSTLSPMSGKGSLLHPIIASWISRNSISLQANSISAKIAFPDFIGSLNDANVTLKTGPDLTFDSLAARIPGATLKRDQEYLNATNIDLTLDKDLKLQVLAKEIASNIQDSGLSFSRLIIQSSLPSFNLEKQKFAIDVSLGSLTLNTTDINLAIPNLSGKIVINDMAFSQVEASFDSLAIDYQDYAMSVPTSSINARMQDTTFLLGFATKDQEITHMGKTGSNAIEANSLKGSAEFQNNGQQYMQFSLQGLQTNQFGVAIALDDINISAQATKTSRGYENLDLSLDSTATFDWEAETISLASPLSLSLHLSDYFTKQSASLDLDPASTNLFPGPFSLSLAYQNDNTQQQIQANFRYGERLMAYVLYDRPSTDKATFLLDSRLDNLQIAQFKHIIDTYAPFLNPYYSEKSLLTGNLSFQPDKNEEKGFGFKGTLSADLAFKDLSIGNRTLNAGSTLLAHIQNDSIAIESLTLTTAGYRMLFSGNTDINTWLPTGNLSLANATDGNSLLAIDFAPLPPSTYSYSVTSPLENSFQLTGIVEHDTSGNISSQARLSVRDKDYPLDVNFSPRTLEATLNSEKKLSVAASFVPPISLEVVADQFPLPSSSLLQDSFLSGMLNFNIDDLYDWKIQTDLVKLTSVVLSGRQYSFSASLDAIPTKIQIKDISIQDSLQVFSGNLLYDGTRLQDNLKAGFSMPFTFYFILDDNSSQSISLALTNAGNNRIEGIASSKALDLGRFYPKLSGLLLNSSFVGYSNLSDDLDLDGNLRLTSSNAWNIPLSIQGDIKAKDSLLTFDDALVSYGSSVLKDFSITLDTSNGILSSLGRFISTDKEGDPPRNSHFKFDVSLGLPKGNSFFALSDILDTAKNQALHASLSLTDILLLGEKGIADGSYSLSYQDQTLRISSDLLSIDYNFGNHDLQATIDKQFGIGLDLSGILSPQNIHLEANNIFVPLSLLNRLFPKPIMSFLDGNVEGQLLLDGPSDTIRTYGQLFVDSSRLKVWWLPQDIISAKNITASFNGERGITPYFPFFSTNTTTGETVRGSGQLTASMKGFSIPSYQVNAILTEGSIFVRLPLLDIDADVKSYASGSFELLGAGNDTWISGDVLIDNATLNMGLKDLPSWYIAENNTSANFTITTGRNVSFFYPNYSNPIIKATINENQKLSLVYDHTKESFKVDGIFSFRSGEIYYFQKNFFITEGSLSLRTDALSGEKGILPKINLRAKMADFDNEGNRVDIYLVLRDSTLSNLNPTFESIPSKSINDILEILGQSILPTGAYGQVNLSSVASLAVAATDVAERLGFINNMGNTDLTEIIRKSLGLDMFSLRSNIVQNVLIDALPGNNSSSFSPLARYLNNTTMFLGKYIGTNFFMQALLHLSAMDSSKVVRSFLVPDLSLDLELSLEWNNPLSTFSLFTQPDELSVNNILDTIGFSVTRRIVLR